MNEIQFIPEHIEKPNPPHVERFTEKNCNPTKNKRLKRLSSIKPNTPKIDVKFNQSNAIKNINQKDWKDVRIYICSVKNLEILSYFVLLLF